MTTLAQARAELIAAYTAASIRATSTPGGEPPYVLVAGGGIDAEHIIRGQTEATFRSVLVAGGFEDTKSAAELDALKLGALGVLRALAGWRLGTIGGDGIRSFSGGDYLSAEASASRMIDV